MNRLLPSLILAAVAADPSALVLPGAVGSPLAGVVAAHGGLPAWRQARALTYDAEFRFGPLVLQDRQTFDLVTRQGRITAPTYRIGFDGKDVWVDPAVAALPLPARFYLWTPFYFYVLPFALNDPGVRLQPRTPETVEGKTYHVVQATFEPGTGDSPDDTYFLYFDPATQQVAFAVYSVTYGPLLQIDPATGKPALSAVVYEEWGNVGGLVLPNRITFRAWTGKGLGDVKGGAIYRNAALGPTAPAADLFARPPTAEVDRSHLAKGS